MAEYGDFREGHTPVSLGRAKWVPGLYQETLRTIRDEISAQQRRRAEQEAAKRNQ